MYRDTSPDTAVPTLDRRTLLKATGALAGAAALGPLAAGGARATLPTIDDALDVATDTLQETLVVFESNAAVDRLRHLDLAEGYHRFRVLPIGYTLLTGPQIETVAGWPEVRYVQANAELTFHNDDARERTGAKAVQEQLFYTGESAHAAVIDSGIDGTHPDHQVNLQHNYKYTNPLERDTMWVDVGGIDTDDNGHGTHVSGSIAGDGTESDGEFKGMAPDADLTVYSTGLTLLVVNSIGAFDHLIAEKLAGKTDVTVVNNSYGPTSGNDADFTPFSAEAVAAYEAVKAGILPVFSAGNSGPGTNTLSNYAKSPFTLGVAATNDETAVTDFSSRGRAPDFDGATNYDRAAALANLTALYESGGGEGPVVDEQTYTGTVGPGSGDAGVGESVYERWTAPDDAGFAEVSVSWTPAGQDIDAYLHEGAQDGPVVASGATLNNPETLAAQVTPGETYFLELVPYANVTATYTADLTATGATTTATPTGPFGLYRPGVGATGESIVSTMGPNDPLQATDNGDNESLLSPYYAAISGTSMSSPVTTGVATLVMDAYNQSFGAFPDPLAVIALLEATARDARDDHNGYNIGAGFVDAKAAVERAAAGDLPAQTDVTLASEGTSPDFVFTPTGSRADDGSLFTGGQTDQVTITLATSDVAAVVRDRVPFDWDVVGGDDHTVYTEGGERFVEFDAPLTAGESRSYFIEAPSGLAATNAYEFGPAQAQVAGADGVFVDITGTETNEVAGVDTNI